MERREGDRFAAPALPPNLSDRVALARRRNVVRIDGDARHYVTDVVDPDPGICEPRQKVTRDADTRVEDAGSRKALLYEQRTLTLRQVQSDSRSFSIASFNRTVGRAIQRSRLRRHFHRHCGRRTLLRLEFGVLLWRRVIPWTLGPLAARAPIPRLGSNHPHSQGMKPWREVSAGCRGRSARTEAALGGFTRK